MRRATIIIIVITVLVVAYLLLKPLSYGQVISKVNSLMNHHEVMINYSVTVESLINNKLTSESGIAVLINNESSYYWSTNLSESINPKELINQLMKPISGEVVSTKRYYTIKAVINNLTIDYDYAKVIASFNKTTGYPISYSVINIGNNKGLVIAYKQVISKPFNESIS